MFLKGLSADKSKHSYDPAEHAYLIYYGDVQSRFKSPHVEHKPEHHGAIANQVHHLPTLPPHLVNQQLNLEPHVGHSSVVHTFPMVHNSPVVHNSQFSNSAEVDNFPIYHATDIVHDINAVSIANDVLRTSPVRDAFVVSESPAEFKALIKSESTNESPPLVSPGMFKPSEEPLLFKPSGEFLSNPGNLAPTIIHLKGKLVNTIQTQDTGYTQQTQDTGLILQDTGVQPKDTEVKLQETEFNVTHQNAEYIIDISNLAPSSDLIINPSQEPDKQKDELETIEFDSTTIEPESVSVEPEFVSTEPEFESKESELVSTEPQFLSSDPEFISTKSEFVSSEAEFISTESAFVSSEPEFISTESEFASSEPEFVTLEPEFVSSEAEFVQEETTFSEEDDDFVPEKSEFVTEALELVSEISEFMTDKPESAHEESETESEVQDLEPTEPDVKLIEPELEELKFEVIDPFEINEDESNVDSDSTLDQEEDQSSDSPKIPAITETDSIPSTGIQQNRNPKEQSDTDFQFSSPSNLLDQLEELNQGLPTGKPGIPISLHPIINPSEIKSLPPSGNSQIHFRNPAIQPLVNPQLLSQPGVGSQFLSFGGGSVSNANKILFQEPIQSLPNPFLQPVQSPFTRPTFGQGFNPFLQTMQTPFGQAAQSLFGRPPPTRFGQPQQFLQPVQFPLIEPQPVSEELRTRDPELNVFSAPVIPAIPETAQPLNFAYVFNKLGEGDRSSTFSYNLTNIQELIEI